MKKLRVSITMIIGLAACQGPESVETGDEEFAQSSPGAAPAVLDLAHPKRIPGRFIVVYKDGVSKQEIERSARVEYAGITVHSVYSVIHGFSGELTDQALASLQKDSRVAYIEADKVVDLHAVQPGPTFSLDRIDQRTGTNGQYNDFGFNGSGVHAYIVDTGLRRTHKEFIGRVGNGFSSVADPSTDDCNGHGTHVAGSVGGTTFGVADRVTLHAVRVFGCGNTATLEDILEGIDWVFANAQFPAVANMSFGAVGGSVAMDDAARGLVDRGVAVAVSAGNDGADACNQSPSREPRVITVGATDQRDQRPNFSNFGSCVDIFAPGVNVLSAGRASDDATLVLTGTSMSSPHVAGALAQIFQRYPRLPMDDVHAILADSATTGVVGDPRGSPNRFLFVDFGTPDPDSCFGACGGQSPSFRCACDEFCQIFGDCCADFQDVCQ